MYKDCTEATVVADSIYDGVRLTTFRATFPRFILAEVNTHRAFCLAGDQQLEFDLPAGKKEGWRRVHRMTIADFVDKWENGARRIAANPKTEYDYSAIHPRAFYTSDEMSAIVGLWDSAINQACRQGKIAAVKAGRKWKFSGEAFMAWRRSKPEHTRFDIRERLGAMQIRQLNESTGAIQHSTVVGVSRSGRKEVFEVKAGDFIVAGSKDHRIMTVEGWKAIGSLTTWDRIIVRKFGKSGSDILDPVRLKKIDGRWRSVWQRQMFNALSTEDPTCRDCLKYPGEDIHHIEPVHKNPARAFDETNITLLCELCHYKRHSVQGWQGNTYLYGAAVQVESITSRGVEETYDLEIAGDFPNFVANGVIVHNSRNSASSRAIPVKRQIELVRESPFVPQQWPKNQAGMQASKFVTGIDAEYAEDLWLTARDTATGIAWQLSEPVPNIHKQIASRLLEPFMWHTAIISSTQAGLDNFFLQRDHEDAQPEMQTLARAMRKALDKSVPIRATFHIPFNNSAPTGALEPAFITAVARCARVSYGRELEEKTYEEDVALVERLIRSGHWSPTEHLGIFRTETSEDSLYHGPHLGNFEGWSQLRHHWRDYLPSIAARLE